MVGRSAPVHRFSRPGARELWASSKNTPRAPRMDNQMEKKMENQMETEVT